MKCPVCRGDRTREWWVKAGMRHALCAEHRRDRRKRKGKA
jgi:hypothetical protein